MGFKDEVRDAAEKFARDLGLEIVDVELVKEGGSRVLRVFADKEGGVSAEDLVPLNEKLSEWLDGTDDSIGGQYYLEVSSPGIDRPLRSKEDFVRFSGNRVTVKTYAPIDGRKQFTGILLGLSQEQVRLEVDGEEVLIPFESVARARLNPLI